MIFLNDTRGINEQECPETFFLLEIVNPSSPIRATAPTPVDNAMG